MTVDKYNSQSPLAIFLLNNPWIFPSITMVGSKSGFYLDRRIWIWFLSLWSDLDPVFVWTVGPGSSFYLDGLIRIRFLSEWWDPVFICMVWSGSGFVWMVGSGSGFYLNGLIRIRFLSGWSDLDPVCIWIVGSGQSYTRAATLTRSLSLHFNLLWLSGIVFIWKIWWKKSNKKDRASYNFW